MGNTIIHCTIRQPLLQDVLPGLAEFPYEVYLQKKENSIYMLRDFRVHRKFTLNEENSILHIGWKKKKSYQALARSEKISCVSVHATQ
jgi:hypothetical protein